MSSKIKCPKCGTLNSTDLPVCRKCGTPLPVGDELEVIRQVVGASFDPKWALFGGVIIFALQAATVFVIMKIEGKDFITGPKRLSLLETTIESVEPNYGFKGHEEEVKIELRLGRKLRNHAGRVKAVYFGHKKAPPYLKERVKRTEAECRKTCGKVDELKSSQPGCQQTCDSVKKMAERAAQCTECAKQCGGRCDLAALAKLPADLRPKCTGCDKFLHQYQEKVDECTKCQKKLDALDGLRVQCADCRAELERYRKALKRCKPSGEGCFSVLALAARQELQRLLKNKPKKEPKEKEEDFEKRLKSWRREVERVKKDISKQEKRTVYVIRPTSKQSGYVPVRLDFATGYTVTKDKAFYYTDSPNASPPKEEKETQRTKSATDTLGFWVMLAISVILYFVGGLLTGRISPGVTMKEPLTAGMAAGLLYVLFLSALGADFTVVIFNAIIGIPFFAGAAYAGGIAGEKWQGTI